MAARQGSQSNAMLYALITFVGLFIISAVAAVVYYVKAEDYRVLSQNAKDDLNKIANAVENGSLAKIVGKPEEGKSYLGTMQNVVNSLYSFILGQAPGADIPATVKYNQIVMETDAMIKSLGQDVNPAIGPNGVALLNTIQELKVKLDNARKENQDLKTRGEALQGNLDDTQLKFEQERQKLLAEVDQFQAEMNSIRDRFESLQKTMTLANDEQIQSFKDKLEQEQAKLTAKQQELQTTENKLAENDTLLKNALTQLDALKPNPDKEVAAFKPDARIVRVDLQNGIVYLDAGLKDHVYRGLTFSIYDRNKPIPEDGKGKAEIEVFQVTDQVSAARIVRSDKKNQIDPEDIVANLIWDSKSANRFVIAGDFDFNNDGKVDADGAQRIREIIERWGGQVSDDVSINTDFMIVGNKPTVLTRPTQDELDVDPIAGQRYEQSKQRAEAYDALMLKANNLGVPVFNEKRFLFLIGYDTLFNMNPLI
ncbi:MAG: hypothetical protein LLF76_08340 [Planctomycetaceae bacterium]|nr:hypothetical protein [Planctomycetaceae bacterium]